MPPPPELDHGHLPFGYLGQNHKDSMQNVCSGPSGSKVERSDEEKAQGMARRPRILIVEDDQLARDNLVHILTRGEYEIDAAASGMEALRRLDRKTYDLVLTDFRMERMDGMEILSKVKERHPDTEVIMITAYATVDSAIAAMKKGAFHYLSKPYSIDEARALVAQALEKKRLKDEVKELRQDLRLREGIPPIIGKNQKIQELIRTVRRIAPADCNVMIFGDTGTGKELFARAVHRASARSDRRFLALNCGAFTEELLANELFGHEKDAFTGASSAKEGLLEAADGGTLFLDEIGDMPASMQVKLLRVIQEKMVLRLGGTRPTPVDVRIVAATNKDLKRLVDEGRFRSDLYFRLNVVSLQIPSLAERKDDIPLLAHYFVKKYCEQQGKAIRGISEEMMEILLSYPFPGNVRELENLIERAVTLAVGENLEARDLPEDLRIVRFRAIRPGSGSFPTLEDTEREYIRWVLSQTDGNKTKAAEILGIDRVSLWRKLKKYQMIDDY
jgi:DNA-binding NtrC family response regulator